MDEREAVLKVAAAAKSRWLSFFDGAPNGHPLVFCLPFAGGGASFYHPWAQLAPKSFSMIAVQPPGREDRLFERSFERMPDLVAATADALIPFLHSPYALFGHSMGGMLAYELAQELRRRNAPLPMHLFVSGAPAPHVAGQIPPIYHLPEPQLLDEIRRRYRGLPDEVLQSRELLDLLLPRLRADLAVTGTYVYRDSPPLTCPITAFGGEDDETVTPAMIAAWREHTVTSFRSEMFPGGHFFVSNVASRIIAALAEGVSK
ncbi:MAG TPA: alpha/beta fold hydrolase [Thermoanaerobaculia bacterium]|nr:alpha/beta fold hydrolase [Thermoanaerobaculia bacterium]